MLLTVLISSCLVSVVLFIHFIQCSLSSLKKVNIDTRPRLFSEIFSFLNQESIFPVVLVMLIASYLPYLPCFLSRPCFLGAILYNSDQQCFLLQDDFKLILVNFNDRLRCINLYSRLSPTTNAVINDEEEDKVKGTVKVEKGFDDENLDASLPSSADYFVLRSSGEEGMSEYILFKHSKISGVRKCLNNFHMQEATLVPFSCINCSMYAYSKTRYSSRGLVLAFLDQQDDHGDNHGQDEEEKEAKEHCYHQKSDSKAPLLHATPILHSVFSNDKKETEHHSGLLMSWYLPRHSMQSVYFYLLWDVTDTMLAVYTNNTPEGGESIIKLYAIPQGNFGSKLNSKHAISNVGVVQDMCLYQISQPEQHHLLATLDAISTVCLYYIDNDSVTKVYCDEFCRDARSTTSHTSIFFIDTTTLGSKSGHLLNVPCLVIVFVTANSTDDHHSSRRMGTLMNDTVGVVRVSVSIKQHEIPDHSSFVTVSKQGHLLGIGLMQRDDGSSGDSVLSTRRHILMYRLVTCDL